MNEKYNLVLTKISKLPVLRIGIKKETHLTKEKKIILVNIICVLLLISFIQVIIIGSLFDKRLVSSKSLIGYCIPTVAIFIIFYLHHLGKYNSAKTILILSSFFTCFIFDVYILPEIQIIFFYITPPLISLSIFNSKKPPFLFLILAICLFLDVFYLKNGIDYSQIHYTSLFLVTFFIPFFLIQTNKNAEKKLQKQQKELEKLNDFKSHFFVNLSHEIRTPLTLIKGYTSRIDLKDSEAETEKKIETINKQVKQIQDIIDNILDLSKLDVDKLELNIVPTPIIPFLNKHYADFKELFNKKEIDFNLKLDIPNIIVNMDLSLISKSLNNLLNNALKFTPKNGEVIVNATYNNSLNITITDNGIGIPKQDIDKVFNRFYQSKNHITKSQGSGIGLSFSKSIIDAHGFNLTLKSIPNTSSVFSIIIPKIATHISQNAPFDISMSHQENNIGKQLSKVTKANLKRRILIVEDHDEMRSYLKTVLNRYNITVANNGDEAIKLLKNQAFDVIVTDYMMPVMDGITFIAEIKKKNIKIPVIVITARKDNKGKLDMLRLGIDAYLTKPFIEEELLINVDRAITFYDSIKEIKSNLNDDEKIYLNNNSDKIFNTKLKNFIEENIKNKNFGVADLANFTNLSRSSLHRKVKLVFGQTPNEIITEVRLQKAKLILEENPIIKKKDLADKVGVYNASYFYKKLEDRFCIVKQMN
ncbi:response regulator [Flavivirga spongiicola]|uniref:histidine kinase n=1 Tax=Flavivirga spongiicola TaxID=421621 RepID=A0ABU7XVT2_9FLAO|nr:response regulator [Flavivirga sp. MEBiC05379]MDO5979898.1 response regulator [Flavivirga sp. MEBiC05379]